MLVEMQLKIIWKIKVNDLGLQHSMNCKQIIVTSSKYDDPKFLQVLEELRSTHPYIKFNTRDIVNYIKPSDQEEKEFTFWTLSRIYNISEDLDELNNKAEIKMQERELNQSGWAIQSVRNV